MNKAKLRRRVCALGAAIPGLLLAIGAKSLVLGERALLLGILLAVALPIACLAAQPSLLERGGPDTASPAEGCARAK
jgi:hypothetical protein